MQRLDSSLSIARTRPCSGIDQGLHLQQWRQLSVYHIHIHTLYGLPAQSWGFRYVCLPYTEKSHKNLRANVGGITRTHYFHPSLPGWHDPFPAHHLNEVAGIITPRSTCRAATANAPSCKTEHIQIKPLLGVGAQLPADLTRVSSMCAFSPPSIVSWLVTSSSAGPPSYIYRRHAQIPALKTQDPFAVPKHHVGFLISAYQGYQSAHARPKITVSIFSGLRLAAIADHNARCVRQQPDCSELTPAPSGWRKIAILPLATL